MTEDGKEVIAAGTHRRLAVDLFNLVWALMDQETRSPEDDDRMLHAAHASRYHWGVVGMPLEMERGEWQVSRVYALLGRAEPALYHARRCLEICTANGIGDFDLAFAYEAVARAKALAGDAVGCDQACELAQAAGKQIAHRDDRDYFFEELRSIATGS